MLQVKKSIHIDPKAAKEMKKFPAEVQAEIAGNLAILARDGVLEEPFAKKIDTTLFEIRVRNQGQWRVIYAYWTRNRIIVLTGFQKKTQKTPKRELDKAKQRWKGYDL